MIVNEMSYFCLISFLYLLPEILIKHHVTENIIIFRHFSNWHEY